MVRLRRTTSEMHAVLAGDPQGGGSPSCGGSRRHRCVTALFAGAQRASGVGGTIPAPAFPLGETGKGAKFPAAAGHSSL
jgi:hypothetical protein